MSAAFTADGAAHASPSPSPASPGGGNGGGGAWEAIIDKAVTQVTEYLTTTTRPFDPCATLSCHMLNLIDRGTLRDVLVERNYNGLCGCFGCGNKPRGLRWEEENAGCGPDGLSFEWPSSADEDGDSEGDKEGEEASDAERSRRRRGETANVAAADEGGDIAEDAEEIVYEDDLYTAESFRLAQRQRAVLNRMQQKQKLREQKATRSSLSPAVAAAAAAQPRLKSSGLLGATFAQRFCSAECVELYETGIVPAVASHMTYDFPVVFSAVTNLFPNLSIPALQQLAGAEVSAGWLVKPIQEHNTSAPHSSTNGSGSAGSNAPLRPVEVGVSYESTERRPAAASGKESKTKSVSFAASSTEEHKQKDSDEAAAVSAASPLLLRDVLSRMHVLQGVWEHEVVPRFTASHLPRVENTHAKAAGTATTNTVVASPSPAALSTAPRPRPGLRGSLLLFDFIMTVRGARTRQLFRLHYARHRAALQASLLRASSCATTRQPLSLFVSVSRSVIAAMEKDFMALHQTGSEGEADALADDLHIDPALQQQRRELLTAHLFSEDVAATLSRLLMVDYALLLNVAWSGVWMRELPLRGDGGREVCSLLRSLRFPSAMPAVLLRSAASSPEVVALATVFLIAAGCCSHGVWVGCANADAAFDEVAEAVGLTEEGAAAAVQSLMLGEEA